MADRPIIFSGPMVRALLEGRKTQTRRVLKPQPEVHPDGCWSWKARNGAFCGASGTRISGFAESARFHCRIQPGDRLWVREAFSYDRLDVDRDGTLPPWYWADGNPEYGDWSKPKPSIHMPRWASRLTLIVTDVRVQRLQDISEADAMAEGAEPILLPSDGGSAPHVEGVRQIWDSLNAKRGFGWDDNPWIVALTFDVIKANIDTLKEAA